LIGFERKDLQVSRVSRLFTPPCASQALKIIPLGCHFGEDWKTLRLHGYSPLSEDDGFVIPLFRCAAILRQKFGANYRKMGWYTKTNQSNMVKHGQNDPN
jgi:hypothetical protein